MALWVVRAGDKGQQEDGALKNNIVTIGWNSLGDLSQFLDFDTFYKYFKQKYPREKHDKLTDYDKSSRLMAGEVWGFLRKIKIQDLVVLPSKKSDQIFIGRIMGDYQYKEYAHNIKHIRRVEWLKTTTRSDIPEQILNSFGTGLTVFNVEKNNAENFIQNLSEGSTKDKFEEGERIIKNYLEQKTGKSFTGFDHPTLVEEIEYKKKIRENALKNLELQRWNEWKKTPGKIIQAVKKACSISGNLLEHRWGPESNSDAPLYTINKTKEFEEILSDFFLGGPSNPKSIGPRLDRLINFVYDNSSKRSWRFFSYLLFLFEWERYFPITPTNFDIALEFYGIREKLTRERKSWAKYSLVLNLVEELKSKLSSKYGPISNLQAHAYLWELIQAVNDSKLPAIEDHPQNWIWSVTQENWEIVKKKNIWASKIPQKIRKKVMRGDGVIFYVIGTGEFKGVFEFSSEWYDATEPVWDDEKDVVKYPSQIKLLPLKIGSVNVYEIASKLSIFPNPDDRRMINLALKGASGYPSNTGKPMPEGDFKKILDAMIGSEETPKNYLLLRHNAKGSEWRDDIGKQYHFGQIPNYTKLIPGSKTIWYDRHADDFYYWGYGDISRTEQESEDHIHAYFDKFTYFNKPSKESPTTDDVVPKKGDKEVQQQIMNLPGWNNQISMLSITKDIYDAIVNAKKLSEEDLGVKMIENLKSKNIDYLTPEDFEKFLNAIPKLEVFNQPGQKPPMNAEQFQLLFRILYGSALKIFDALNIRVKDLDLDNRIIRFSDSTSKFLYATILPTDVSYLKECVSTLQKDDKLFDVHRATLWNYAKQVGNLAGLKIFRGKEERETEGMDLLIFRESRAMQMSLDGARDGLIRRKLRVDFSNAVLRYDQPTIEDLKEWELKNSGKPSDIIPQIETFDDHPLEPISEQEMKTGYEELRQELLIPEKKVKEIVTALASGSHVILAGPIGTGKTELARKIPQIFWKKNGCYYSDVFTATADWNTQDVIGGIMPKMEEGKVVYKIQDGCVTESVRKNWSGSLRRHYGEYHGVWTIIDEFNRADIDKAFGQLFTALRTRDLKVQTNSIEKNYEELKIPEDYRIIGTLNTADKHYLFPLSNALKSRFAFIEIDIPDKDHYKQEIYYAVKNALESLGEKNFSELKLNHQTKSLDIESNSNLYDAIYKAYNFLLFIRQFKKLGTALLKTIIQNLITGKKMSSNLNDVLDNSINSTIIPQLELSEVELGIINAMIKKQLVSFLKDINKTNKRHTSHKVFTKTMEFLNLDPTKYDYFTQREIKDDDNLWREINFNFTDLNKIAESSFPTGLEQVTRSLDSLIEESII